jgi:CD36 family.
MLRCILFNSSLYSGVPTIFFPMFWFEESAKITPELAQSLKMLLALPVVGTYCSYAALLLGLLIMVFVGALKVTARLQWSMIRSWKR